MSNEIKPVRYDDQAVAYGQPVQQTREVASGVVVSLGGGVLQTGMLAGVSAVLLNAGALEIVFAQPQVLPYQGWVQLSNQLALPSQTIIHAVRCDTDRMVVVACDLSGVFVDLSTIPWDLWFSARVPA